jgi:hypothetical protein
MRKKPGETKFTKFTVYMEPELLEQIKARAEEERRSVSSLLTLAAQKYMKKAKTD